MVSIATIIRKGHESHHPHHKCAVPSACAFDSERSLNRKMMEMTVHIISFVFIVCQALFVSSKTPPHIILIVADDLGWNDVQFHGSPQIPTPNIDKLARTGIILNNYYVSPICTPSRSALMSGLHPIHTGMQHDVIYCIEPWGFPLKYTLLPERLKRLGYVTHAIGKWHLGFFKKEYTPTYRGFDSHFGYWNGRQDYYNHMTQIGDEWGLDFRHNMNVVSNYMGMYSTKVFGNHAIELIRQNHNSKNPLFLYLAYQAVHSANDNMPLQAPPEYVERFSHIADERRRMYAALDDSIGQVIHALDKWGMLKDSIVVFTSDNGGPAAGLNNNAASNWPLRGAKLTLWEGGVRGVGVIWSSSLLKQRSGSVSMQMMHVCDWLPTLYEAAGGNVSDLGAIDGISLWRALQKGLPSPRTEILHNIDPIWNVAAIRVGDFKLIDGTIKGGQWDGWYGPSGRENITTTKGYNEIRNTKKLVHINGTPAEVLCGNPPANVTTNCKPLERPCLFNIREDPCEYNNIADQYPQISWALLEKLEEYEKTAVPPGNKPADPKSSPKLHGYIWEPWMDGVILRMNNEDD